MSVVSPAPDVGADSSVCVAEFQDRRIRKMDCKWNPGALERLLIQDKMRVNSPAASILGADSSRPDERTRDENVGERILRALRPIGGNSRIGGGPACYFRLLSSGT